MERIAMSQQERDRLEWLKQARDKRLTQPVVAERMGVRWQSFPLAIHTHYCPKQHLLFTKI